MKEAIEPDKKVRTSERIELDKNDDANDKKESKDSNSQERTRSDLRCNSLRSCFNRPDRCFLTLISVAYVAFAFSLVISCLVNR